MAAGPFKPYLIGNARVGLDLSLDPWLLPGDAYTQLDNCHLYQGRIEKRRGQQVLAALSNRVIDSDTLTLVTDVDTGTAVVDPLVNTTLPIMGLFQYSDNLGNLQLIAVTTQRLFRFVPALGYFYDMAGANLWSGTDSDFFHAATWLNNMFLCNGAAGDQLYYYDGSHVFPVTIDPDGTGANTVTGMLSVFAYKDRLVVFNTVEGGVRVPQMARWSPIGDPTGAWRTQDYLRAPTQDVIVGAAFVGDEINVFFNKSVWAFRYIGDTQQPFIWVRLPGVGGATGKQSVLAYRDQAISIGPSRIIGSDGLSVSYVDERIPSLVSMMNPTLLKYCHSVLHEQQSQIWITYPSLQATTYPDKMLILNFDDRSWSTYTYAMHVLGLWDQAYDSGTGAVSAGYPQLLAGTLDGRVVQLNQGGTDLEGSAITATVATGQLNPFKQQARRCYLGWVDLLVDTQPTGSATVQFFADGCPVPYVTLTDVPLTDSRGGTKSLLRLPVNCESDFHQIWITHATPDNFVVHAAILYAKPGGRLYG